MDPRSWASNILLAIALLGGLPSCSRNASTTETAATSTSASSKPATPTGNAQAPGGITLRVVGSENEVRQKGVPHAVDFTVVHLNDVYSAPPVEGGHRGGLARVATLRRKLAEENANVMTVLSGDFVSPSVISTLSGDAGKHMIEGLNVMGLNYATMGNHEFDLSEQDLLARIGESRFQWIVSNVKDAKGQAFPKVTENAVVTFSGEGGEQVRVAWIGICLDMIKSPWVTYQNSIESARAQVEALSGKADVVLAMTHLPIEQDKQLGAEVPRLDVLLGGHEHAATEVIVGDDQTPIFKADANARTAYVHRFRFDTQTHTTKLFSQLVPIDDSIAEEPETAAVVAKWSKETFDKLRAQGHDPQEVVGHTSERLMGFESDVRSKPTNLTQLILEAMRAEAPEADAIILPSGLIRIDGIIPPGDIVYYDIVQIFPMDIKMSVLNMPGSMLRTLLKVGDASQGSGAFQLRADITGDEKSGWKIKGAPLADATMYKIAFSETPTAALSQPPYRDTGTTKIRDGRALRAILVDRLRRDLPKSGH